ncbi:MAG: D-alanine--D-alanine ligase family protein [Parcubacteria group bacterium]
MNIGVFFGGKSPEHDVSIITGQLIISELKKMGRLFTPVYLGKNGEWYIGEELDDLKFFMDKQREQKLPSLDNYSLSLKESKRRLVFEKKGLLSKKVIIDLAFPCFHGSNGEDGTIQGLFEMFNVPYVGCDVASSAVAFDKVLTKLLYQSLNIPTAKFIHFSGQDWMGKKEEIISEIKRHLRFPLFVKPPKLGSSIGITRAKDENELESGIELALHYGEKVLVEEGVENLADITCCVIGNDELTASLVQESIFDSDLFNFEEKYLKDGGAQTGSAKDRIIIPARLDEKTTTNVQAMAKQIYKSIGSSGIARVDFLFDKQADKLYANEINPLPGNIYFHLWEESGLGLDELLEKLLQFAIERHTAKNKITYTFKTDLMDFANSVKLKMKK